MAINRHFNKILVGLIRDAVEYQHKIEVDGKIYRVIEDDSRSDA